MKQDIVLEAEKREPASKGTVNTMRRQGRVPGVVYGDKDGPMALSVDEKSLQKVIHSERGRNALINLQVEKSSHPVLLKEIQRHAITRAILHVDFHRISLKQKVEASVPVHMKGEAPGVKLSGGVLEHLIRELRVRCLPADIPAFVDADVSTLQIGQALRVKDLSIPEGVELLVDAETMIINVVSPTILEEPAAGTTPEASATTEPEVIKKGKVEEGEEGAAPAKPGAAPAAGAKAGAPAAGAKPGEGKKPEGK